MELEEIKEYKKKCITFFVGIILIICIWIFVYAIWEATGKKISHRVLTKVLEVGALISGICYVRMQKLKCEEIGLSKKNIGSVIVKNIIFSIIAIGIMVLIKAVLINSGFDIFDKDKPFWNWNVMSWARWIYPITVLVEEFIINGIGQESLDRIFEGGNNAYGTILILAIYFGAAHIHKGVGYMIGASVMCLILCIAYRKQKTIWGISITHYLLGMAAKFLGYI